MNIRSGSIGLSVCAGLMAIAIQSAKAQPAGPQTVSCAYPHGWNVTDFGRDLNGIPEGDTHRCPVVVVGEATDRAALATLPIRPLRKHGGAGTRPRAVWVAHTMSLGRYTKTPSGNFNSTRSLEDGSSSGEGSGPGGGSPNGG